jgi:hypothetical protein
VLEQRSISKRERPYLKREDEEAREGTRKKDYKEWRIYGQRKPIIVQKIKGNRTVAIFIG